MGIARYSVFISTPSELRAVMVLTPKNGAVVIFKHILTHWGDRDGPGVVDASFLMIFEAKIMIFDAKTMFFTLPTSFASFSVAVWSYELIIFKLVTNEI